MTNEEGVPVPNVFLPLSAPPLPWISSVDHVGTHIWGVVDLGSNNVKEIINTDSYDNPEKYNDYLKELGVSLASRKLGSLAKQCCVISSYGNLITIKSKSIFRTVDISFKTREEFEETTANKRLNQVRMGEGKLMRVPHSEEGLARDILLKRKETLDYHRALTQGTKCDGQEDQDPSGAWKLSGINLKKSEAVAIGYMSTYMEFWKIPYPSGEHDKNQYAKYINTSG
nr:PREDICTED: uncharacterized protein LOC104153550 [Struthio camelus australis]